MPSPPLIPCLLAGSCWMYLSRILETLSPPAVLHTRLTLQCSAGFRPCPFRLEAGPRVRDAPGHVQGQGGGPAREGACKGRVLGSASLPLTLPLHRGSTVTVRHATVGAPWSAAWRSLPHAGPDHATVDVRHGAGRVVRAPWVLLLGPDDGAGFGGQEPPLWANGTKVDSSHSLPFRSPSE